MKQKFNINYDIVVIGSGFSGSILARLFAEEQNKKILLIEKRNHFGGNMFDYLDDGILVQKYGPHTFHTNKDHVYDFISKYAKMVPYKLTYRAILKGIPVPCPFNFETIRMLYNPEDAEILIEELKKSYIGREAVPIFELLESPNEIVSLYAKMLFEEDFKPYTSKQWGKNPDEIDESILKRVPVILNSRDTYFNDKYEVQPEFGFTNLLLNIIDHPNITCVKDVDALQFIEIINNQIIFDKKLCPVIYTGPIDALFQNEFGQLPYRSLHFVNKHLPVKSFQDTAIVAYPKDVEYTRITEYTKLPIQDVGERTFISYEYPLQYNPLADKGNEPFYPIVSNENMEIYKLYLEKAKQIKNLVICGRLADYKYYNMDEVIDRTLNLYESIKGI
jgi:UDP-galactopyranose mutase